MVKVLKKHKGKLPAFGAESSDALMTQALVFVHNQRYLYSQGLLDQHKVTKLESIVNWTWDAYDKKWEA